VLLLDEPYTGLDAHAAQGLTDLLAALAEGGCTVLLTTHNLAQGPTVGQRVVVLARGRVAHDVPRAGLDPADFAGVYRQLTE
jgi:ABC-type sulfate/molybdate transport systems ATPase subunit